MCSVYVDSSAITKPLVTPGLARAGTIWRVGIGTPLAVTEWRRLPAKPSRRVEGHE